MVSEYDLLHKLSQQDYEDYLIEKLVYGTAAVRVEGETVTFIPRSQWHVEINPVTQ